MQTVARGVHGGELPENLISPRKLDHYLNRTGHRGEDHLALERRDLPVQGKNRAETRGIENAGVGEVEDEVSDAGTNLVLTGRLELRRVTEIQRLADLDDYGLLILGF